jgi:hypothetical protein
MEKDEVGHRICRRHAAKLISQTTFPESNALAQNTYSASCPLSDTTLSFTFPFWT